MSGLLYSTTDAETNSSTRITDTLAESNKYHDLPERNNECSRYQNTTSLTMSVDMDVEGESVKSGRRQKESNQEDGMVLSIQEAVRKFYSTTSSVYAEHTISNPNAEQILFCISTVLQAQIFDDINASFDNRGHQQDFDHIPILPPEHGGDVEILPGDIVCRESQHDAELRTQLIAGVVPTVETIYRFLNLLKEHARYPTECNIVALIYTNRMTSMGSMPLTMRNWRAVWVISIILAQKMWDDRPLRSSAFAIILPSFSKQLLRDLELKALGLLQFSSGVKPSLYAQYYFELRSLFYDIKGTSPSTASSEWTYKPLSIIEARRLEDRSNNVWDKKKKSGGKSLSPVRSSPDHDPRSSILQPKSTSEKSSSEKSSSGSSRSSSLIASPLNKGWQTSSPAQAHAHARLRMIGMHEESKGRNFNPYVFDARPRSLVRKSEAVQGSIAGEGKSTESPSISGGDIGTNTTSSPQSLSTASANRTPSATNPQGYEYTNGWSFRGEDPVVRTYEDVTLTDTSRFVLS